MAEWVLVFRLKDTRAIGKGKPKYDTNNYAPYFSQLKYVTDLSK